MLYYVMRCCSRVSNEIEALLALHRLSRFSSQDGNAPASASLRTAVWPWLWHYGVGDGGGGGSGS